MRSPNRIAGRSITLPLSADDIIEFHLARLLLLLKFCGTAGRIDGLTKIRPAEIIAILEKTRRTMDESAERLSELKTYNDDLTEELN